MVFTPNPQQKTAFQTARGIANPLSTQQRQRYRTLRATDPTRANTFAAKKLNLTGYDPAKAQLNPLQRYRFLELQKTNPQMAQTFRQGVIARKSAAGAPGATTSATVAPTQSQGTDLTRTMNTLFPRTPDLANFGSAGFLNNLVGEFSNPETSEMYKWRLGQGQKDLNNWLASKGQLGSGAGIKAGGDLIAQIGAEESDKAYERALTAAQMGQTGAYQGANLQNNLADRLERMQAAESLRRERAGNNTWDRRAWVIDKLLNQNPLATAFSASSGQSDLYSKIAAAIQAASMSGGGEGGGGGAAPMPFPQVDYSLPNMFDIGSDMNYNNELMNGIGTWLFG